jgi:NAD(P)-dependent dehydrogenase (short-subunit alcohol dehydrogenase family)
MASAGHGQLKGLTALITGGGTGIGRGIALLFAREGAAVAVAGRRREPLDALVAEIESAGGQALAATGDVSKPEDCQQIVMAAVTRFQSLNILVNNAGIARFGAVDLMSDGDIRSQVEINLIGPMLMTRYAIPELVKSKARGAAILNIGTSAVNSVVKNFAVYSAAKAGLVHFTRCMALDMADERVRVNCINPGVVETPIFETMMPASRIKGMMDDFAKQTPLGRVGKPEDIAEAALFLCSPRSSWVTGSVLTVDGGISLA